MKSLTAEQRDQIVAQFTAGVPLNDIARAFGTYKGFVSALALKRGCPPRHVYRRTPRSIRLRPDVDAELQRTARRQRTTPNVLIGEAVAAYLGLDR